VARQPQTFNDFVGQRKVVRYVERLIRGAREHGSPCPSLLLAGRSGCGKTALARAVAREYGSTFHPLLAGEDLRPFEICTTLAGLRHGDVLLLDEAHALKRDAQQVLYLALDEQKVPARSAGRLDRGRHESIAAFTLVLATNEPGRLKPALRRRLTAIEFAPYSLRELVAVGKKAAAEEGIDITTQAARRLAEAAQGSPGRMHQRLAGLRLFWPDAGRFTQQHVDRLLRQEGIDARGLTRNQRLYLRTLAASPGGTCPLKGLATRLGCDSGYLQDEVEPYLIDRLWIEVASGAGRRITDAGRAVIDEMATEQSALKKVREEVTP
jgi:Holliday junction DNA helicase RuvB